MTAVSMDHDVDSTLDHPRRRRIYETVHAEPGLNWNQLQRRTGLSVGALMFHLDRLEDGGAILRRPSTSENEVLFFTPDNVELWRDPRTRILFGNEATRRIAGVLADRPGISVGEIAEEVGLTAGAIRYHLQKLGKHDLIRRQRDGRRVHYEPVPRLSDWMERFG